MHTVSFVITLVLAAIVAGIGVVLAPAHRKLVAIVSVVGLFAIAASAPAVADFTSNPTGHTHPSPALPIGAYTITTPSPSCSWTDNLHISLSFSNASSWATTEVQRWSNSPPFADYTNVAAGTTTYSDVVTAGTQYDYQLYGKAGTNWVSPMSSTLTSNTCTNAIDSVARPVATAQIHQAYGLAVDSSGDIAIADTGGNYVEFVPKYTGTYFGVSMTANNMYWVLGTGSSGDTGDGGLGTLAKTNAPQSVAFDSHNNIVVADTGGNTVRLVVNGPGVLAGFNAGTFFGSARNAGYVYDLAGVANSSGDGTSGTATSALLHSPSGVTLDSSDNIYIADTTNNKIKAVCNSACTPMGLSSVAALNIKVIAGNGTAALVDSSTITSQELQAPAQMAFNAAQTTLYIADTSNHVVRALASSSTTDTSLTTFAGTGVSGDLGDGTAKGAAKFNAFFGVAVDSSGNVLIADGPNDKMKIVPAAGCSAGACAYGYPGAESANAVYTIAGTGAGGDLGPGYPTYNGGSAYSKIQNVRAIAMGPDGYVYFADGSNDKIRALKPDSSANPCASPDTTTCTNGYDIVDVVGTGTAGSAQGTAAGDEVASAQGIAVDSSGNVYFADPTANVVREYIASTGRVRVVAGKGPSGTAGDAGLAVQANLNAPTGVALDATNSMLFIAANSNNKIRAVCVKPTGSCTSLGTTIKAGYLDVVAGTGTSGTSTNGTAATSAKVSTPQGVAWDSTNSKLYIADTGSNTVKVVSCAATCSNSANWLMSVFAGTNPPNVAGYAGDGGSATGATVALNGPLGVAVDSTGSNVYIADTGNQLVRLVNGGNITRFAGTANSAGSTGDGGSATGLLAKLSSPAAVSVNSSGTVYIADSGNNKIRYVSGGNINNILGTGVQGYTNDDGYYGLANIDTPKGVFVANGNLYIGQTVTGADAAVRVVYGVG